MEIEILQKADGFVRQERLCVITTSTAEGQPHSSVMHYSCGAERFCLYFSTDDRSMKAVNCLVNNRAAVALGWSEVDWVTVQMHGTLSALTAPDQLAAAKAAHYARHPNSQQFEHDPHTVFLEFRPTWIRLSDLAVDPAVVDELTCD